MHADTYPPQGPKIIDFQIQISRPLNKVSSWRPGESTRALCSALALATALFLNLTHFWRETRTWPLFSTSASTRCSTWLKDEAQKSDTRKHAAHCRNCCFDHRHCVCRWREGTYSVIVCKITSLLCVLRKKQSTPTGILDLLVLIVVILLPVCWHWCRLVHRWSSSWQWTCRRSISRLCRYCRNWTGVNAHALFPLPPNFTYVVLTSPLTTQTGCYLQRCERFLHLWSSSSFQSTHKPPYGTWCKWVTRDMFAPDSVHTPYTHAPHTSHLTHLTPHTPHTSHFTRTRNNNTTRIFLFMFISSDTVWYGQLH